jgi:hypothetical protein
MLILVTAFQVSNILHYQEKTYDRIAIQIPPNFMTLNNNYDYLKQMVKEFELYLQGPLFVPSFDTYDGMSQFIINRTQDLSGSLLETNMGMEYGNLIQRGSLHFAPFPSDEVESLIQYLNGTSKAFRSRKVYKHETESKAIHFIRHNSNQDPILALIVIKEVKPRSLHYVIRQNFTTLPKTSEVIKYPSPKLSTAYQRYILSGYLTLQNEVDGWAFQYTGATNSSKMCSSPPPVAMIPFPTSDYEQNPYFLNVKYIFGLTMTSELTSYTTITNNKIVSCVQLQQYFLYHHYLTASFKKKNWYHQHNYHMIIEILH